MKVMIFDEQHENDLMIELNHFLIDHDIIDIKYQVSIGNSGDDQIYCFSALVMYND